MKEQSVLESLIENLLLSTEQERQSIPESVLLEISRSPKLILELNRLSTLLTGEESTLLSRIERLGLKNADTADDEKIQTVWDRAPTYLSFSDWFQQNQTASLNERYARIVWSQIQDNLHQITDDITILFNKTSSSFHSVPPGLSTKLVPLADLRGQEGSGLVELLEIPFPVTDLNIFVQTAQSQTGASTLGLQLKTLSSSEPVPQVGIVLCDGDDNLLERTASDDSGRTTFHNLDEGKYSLYVQHADMGLVLSITLRQS